MARLVILSGAHKAEEFELQRGSNFLGRAEANDFVLDDPTVSSRHCEIIVSDLSVRVRDLGSTNGTFIDTQRIQYSEARNGQVIMLGSMEMRLLIPPTEISIPPLTVEDQPQPTVLADGTHACLNHPATPALFKCRQCSRHYCDACVRELHLIGGKSRVFCPACSGACDTLGPTVPTRRRSFASRLLETIRIPFRRSGGKGP